MSTSFVEVSTGGRESLKSCVQAMVSPGGAGVTARVGEAVSTGKGLSMGEPLAAALGEAGPAVADRDGVATQAETLAATRPASSSTANGFARPSNRSIDPVPLELMTVPSWLSTRRMAESCNEQTIYAVKVLCEPATSH
jgi:hypothetical protein